MKKIGWFRFLLATGNLPKQDDLERSNCEHAGIIGHESCGWSARYNKPNFMVPFREVQAERHGS